MTGQHAPGDAPCRLDDVIVREIAGEVFLVPIRGRLADLQELFVLNGVGEWLWQRLDGSRSVRDLSKDLAETYEVEEDEAVADVTSFLGELEEAGLLEAAAEDS